MQSNEGYTLLTKGNAFKRQIFREAFFAIVVPSAHSH